MSITIHREIQLPLQGTDFSKNRVEVSITADTVAEAESQFDEVMESQMKKFKTNFDDIQQYNKAVIAIEYLKALLDSPLAPHVKKFLAAYKEKKTVNTDSLN